jgi:sugar phosphate isomerase/epimerase
MQIGVMLNNLERDRLRAFAVAAQLGFRYVHTSALPEAWLCGPEREQYVAAARASGLVVATMFIGFDGQSYADLPTIARTVGLVIPELRDHRCAVALQYSDLAQDLGVTALGMHLGFLPAPGQADYAALVSAVRGLLDSLARRGQALHLETGQEPAGVLLRFYRDVDRPNLGVNFDTANFILYGTDSPLSALEVLGPLVRGVHCKDGTQTSEPGTLGADVPLGQGDVPFCQVLQRLHDLGYRGPLIIEREAGPNVVTDILAARSYLTGLLTELARTASG